MNYISGIQPWVKSIMEEREANPMRMMYKNPYVVMSSGALVTKLTDNYSSKTPQQRIDIIKLAITDPASSAYRGCIISNNINNIELSYSLDKTPVGVDFNGKVITVDGESGRKVSTPIILSVNVDTEESNNTLKVTTVQVKCFTLKQLEMFEMFFLKPGMNIMIEWGDSSFLKRINQNTFFTKENSTVFLQSGIKDTFKPYTLPEEALFITKWSKFEDYCDHFADVYIQTTTSSLDIQKNIRQSLGSYDYAAGKVTNYSYNINDDGTYDVSIEVSQGNQLSLAIPKSNPNTNTGIKSAQGSSNGGNNPDRYTQIKECIVSDLNLDSKSFDTIINKTSHPIDGGDWKNEFFNFLKKNEQQKDTLSNSDAYVSLRFVFAILANYSIDETQKDFAIKLPEYTNKATGKKEGMIPVHSSKFMLSSSPDILFPLDTIPLITTGSNGPGNENSIIIQSGSKVDGRIGPAKYNFHINTTYIVNAAVSSATPEIDPNKNGPIGNALNIFIKYNTIVRLWNTNTTRIDFLTDVLRIVNDNGYGLYKLTIGAQHEGGASSFVCYQFANQDIKDVQEDVNKNTGYRFKPTTINSVVKNFSYTFQMDNLMAGRMIFNSNAGIRNAYATKKNNPSIKEIPLPKESFNSFDYSSFANADNYYSVNNVDRRKQEKLINTIATTEQSKTVTSGKGIESTTTNTSTSDFTQTIQSNSVFYKVSDKNDDKTDSVRLVYKNKPLIHNAINGEHGPNGAGKSLVTNIEISVTIDGFSGFRCGECFNIDGVPEVYNQLGVFQIRNIKHSVSDSEGWITTLEAMWRVGK